MTANARYVKTQFVVEGTTQAPAMIGTPTYSIPTTGKAPISFTLDNSVYDKDVDATVKISGVENPLSSGSVKPGTPWNGSETLKYTATGDGYVVVTVGNLEARTLWNITKSADLSTSEAAAIGTTNSSGSAVAMSALNPELTTVDDVLIIRTDKASDTGLKNGDEVKFTASVGQRSSAWDASVYTVTLDTNYGPLNFEIDVTSTSPATDTATVRINGKDLVINDLTVDVKTDLVKVNTIEKGANNYTVVVTFNQGVQVTGSGALSIADIKAKASGVSILSSTDPISHTAGSNQVTITLSRGLQNGDQIILNNTILSSDNENSAMTAVTYTYDAANNEFTI